MLAGLPSCFAQNGGGSMSSIQRVTVAVRSVCVTSKGVSGDRLVPDAARVHIGLVGQVHQVVDDETVIAFQAVEGAALADPFGAVVPMEVRDRGRIRKAGSPGHTQTRRCRSTIG